VPLADAAMKLVSLGRPYLFEGLKPGRPLSNTAMLMLLRDMREGYTVHGFRSAFSTWAQCTDFPREIVESCLAHASGDAVELA
jgi:integrase